MTHQMPQLPYANNALEPVISQQTIDFHYGKHLKTYVDNLNNLVQGTEYADKTLEEIVKTAPDGPIFNNAGQVMNHTLYFEQLTPGGKADHSLTVVKVIEQQFGTMDAFKKEFIDSGVRLFGSGWVWLSIDDSGKLYISKEANAGIPLRNGRKPLLCLDVWEHAYYLDYQNRRAEHLEKVWNLINWEVVNHRM